MSSKNEKNLFSKYTDKMLKIYKIMFLIAGIFFLISGCMLLLVALYAVVFIAIGILFIFFSKKCRSELNARQDRYINYNSNKPSAVLSSNINPSPSLNKERHNIAGTSFRQNEIKSLGMENEYYSMTKKELIDECMENETIYQIDFSPNSVELIEEPNNEYDPNAIKVIIDNVHVGYIKKGSCSHIKKLIRENKICNISADIHGGKYKRVSYEYDVDSDRDIYKLENGKTDFFVSILLELFPDKDNNQK